jgi:predicted lipoprotein with Yx(FWY)xxD motif
MRRDRARSGPRRALSATLLVAAVLLTGCGTQQAPTGDSSAGGAVVQLQHRPHAGTVVVDASGKTLYLSEQEVGGVVRCTGICLETWAPLTVDSTSTPRGDSGVLAEVGTVRRPDGRLQITYAGRPLYTYAHDGAAGDAKGDGVYDVFGGHHFRWHVAGYPPTTAWPMPSPSASSGGT